MTTVTNDTWKDQQKEAAGSLATFAWIVSGLYLYLTNDGTTISWSALGFFVIGMFAAAVLFGGALVIVQRLVARVLMWLVPSRIKNIATPIIALGYVLRLGMIVCVFLAASRVFGILELGVWTFHRDLLSNVVIGGGFHGGVLAGGCRRD
jgi:hypothetical protein